VSTLFGGRVAEWVASYGGGEPRDLTARNLLARRRLAVEMVGAAVPPTARVLDLGCGTGEVSAQLIRLGYEVWGLDIAEPMVRYARDRCRSNRFRVGDMERLPFPDDTFDAVVCLGVIEYLAADDRALREIWRVLRPGGTAVISTPSAISPLPHLDRLFAGLTEAARPLHHLVKYRLRGKRAPDARPSRDPAHRKYHRGPWLRLLRSMGLEAEDWVCHGWGWYKSGFEGVVLSLHRTAALLRRALERFGGRALLARARQELAHNRALNWLAAEQVVRVRAVKC
jgi:SAM-dependent methyltransferase